MKVAFQADPLDTLRIETDTTLCLAREALRRGFEVWYYAPRNLAYQEGVIFADCQRILSIDDEQRATATKTTSRINLAEMDIILIRQDPPFDMDYLTYTYLLEKLDKVLILNNPSAIRNFPEKLAPLLFRELMPPTLITSDLAAALAFLEQHHVLVCKPLYQFGGNGIELFDLNHLALLKKNWPKLIRQYQAPMLLQKFLPEIAQGDKRVLLLNGEVLAMLNRTPKPGMIKANVASGGTASKTSLNQRDQQIIETIKPLLKDNMILLAGIDIIGPYLTEINITSPTGVALCNHLYQLKGTNRLEYKIWQKILKLYAGRI